MGPTSCHEPRCSFPLLDPEEVLRFTGVVSPTGVALLAGSADTCWTREASQLAGQFGGPNRVRPSIMLQLTPHKFGTIWPSRMTWLVAMLSISCQEEHITWRRESRKTPACCGGMWRCTKADSCTLTALMAFSVCLQVAVRARLRMSSCGTTGVRYGLSSTGSKASMSSVASFPACQTSCNKHDCSSMLSPMQSIAGCTAFTHRQMAAKAPQTQVQLMAVDFLRDFQTMVCTSLQASWYSLEKVRVAVLKPCMISWKASWWAFSSSVSAGLASNGASNATARLTARLVTMVSCLVGPVGSAPIVSLAPSSLLTISCSPSLFPPWSLSGASPRSPSSSLLTVSGLYQGVWSCQAVDPASFHGFQ